MPSRKEIQWSQLKVGALVMVGIAVLIVLIFLMSASSGGLFAHKVVLRSYFENASGLKNGAPVTLEGVTIGNVTRIRIVPERNPNPVEVTMQVSSKTIGALHVDSTTSIAQAGVLGDSFVDISSVKASGPPPPDNTELKARNIPSIQQVVDTSQDTLQQASTVMRKVNVMMDTLNSKRGSAGKLINDPDLYNKVTQLADNLERLTRGMGEGKGSLGKLLTDDSLYDKIDQSVDQLSQISQDLHDGKGTAGKILHDESLYNNLNATVQNANKLIENLNNSNGALNKLTKDPVFAQKVEDTVDNLDGILKSIHEGNGTLGQLLVNRSMYDHADQTMDQAQQLLKGMREDPKKYFVIRLKVF